MTPRAAQPRTHRWRPGWMLSAGAAVIMLGGCTQSVTGVPAAAGSAVASPPSTAEATTAATAAAPSSSACRVSITGGSIRMSGGGGRVRSVNNAHQFACRGGPLVALESIDAAGVRFRIDTTSVLVAVGATEQVGPYKITVRQLDDPAAEFDVDPAG